MRLRTFTSCFVTFILLILTNTSLAKPDANSYWQAGRAAALADAMKTPVVAPEIKDALLTRTRSEDREFAKSILVHWKKNSETNITSEFNRILIRDHDGKEVLIMVPTENTPDQFYINGVTWQIPAKGSIAQSLKKNRCDQFSKKVGVIV